MVYRIGPNSTWELILNDRLLGFQLLLFDPVTNILGKIFSPFSSAFISWDVLCSTLVWYSHGSQSIGGPHWFDWKEFWYLTRIYQVFKCQVLLHVQFIWHLKVGLSSVLKGGFERGTLNRRSGEGWVSSPLDTPLWESYWFPYLYYICIILYCK